jgi:hypothetical protein
MVTNIYSCDKDGARAFLKQMRMWVPRLQYLTLGVDCGFVKSDSLCLPS